MQHISSIHYKEHSHTELQLVVSGEIIHYDKLHQYYLHDPADSHLLHEIKVSPRNSNVLYRQRCGELTTPPPTCNCDHTIHKIRIHYDDINIQ